MVILLVIALLMPAVVSADTIDEDGLRQLLAPSETEHERRNTRSKVSGGLTVPVKRQPPVRELHSERSNLAVKAGDPLSTTAPAESANAVSPATPQVTKYRVQKKNAGGSIPISAAKQQRKWLPADPDIYIPPPRVDTESTTHSQVYSQKSRTFGIVIGTWFKAHIERRITNADNGQVEVILDEDVIGKMKALPAGTTLFGQKAFNQVSQRLDLSLSNGITPVGFEFDLSATVYDSTKVSGLSGSVVRQRGTEVRSAASRGALTSAKALMSATIDNAAAGALVEGVGQAGDELLNNERRFIREPRVLIQVTPQPVLVRINQTF